MLGPEFEATLAAARDGSRPALAALYEDLQPSVLAYLRARHRSEAEDLASEAWLSVAEGLGRFEGDESGFRGWVFTIVRRRLVDAHRRASRQRMDPVPGEFFLELVEDTDPESEILNRQAADAALAVVRELTKDQADVVLLRVVAGLSVDEVAHAMGKRPGTVRVLQHRALRRLAQILEGRAASSEVRDEV